MREQSEVVDAIEICYILIAITLVVRKDHIQASIFRNLKIAFIVWPIIEKGFTIIDWNIRKGLGVPNDDRLILSRNANNVVHNVKFLRLEVFASLHQHIDYRVQDRIITFHNSVNGQA